MEDYEKEHYWEFTLRDNPLTKDNTEDCVAEVKTGPRTLQNEDIAKEIKRTGSELKYATILSVVQQNNEIILEALLNGDSVMTDLCQFIPRILGPFPNSRAEFDLNVNKLTFDIILSKAVREALKRVKTIKLGTKADVALIDLVTDTITGKTDGSITKDKYIRIEGERIKIAGSGNVGVFFVSEDGSKRFKSELPYINNNPSEVLALVPAELPDGKYTLNIVTQYSQSNFLLKEPRTLTYSKLLIVGNGGGSDRPEIE